MNWKWTKTKLGLRYKFTTWMNIQMDERHGITICDTYIVQYWEL